MPYTDTELASLALVKLGALPLSSFADQSAEAEIAKRIYPLVRDGLLSAHPWGFTLARLELQPSEPQQIDDGRSRFEVPADMIRSASAGVGSADVGIPFTIEGAYIVAASPTVTLKYHRRAPESLFPSHFASALTARLAAEFCFPITESTSRAEALFRLAEAELSLAKLVDSQQKSPQRIEDFSLIRARFA
ncbi:MAG: hypothetical protein AAFY56_20175 [Pseudomonadota bacterium]